MKNYARIYALIIDNELVGVSLDGWDLFEEAWNEIAGEPCLLKVYMRDYGLENEEEAFDMFLDNCGCKDFGIEIRIFERKEGDYKFSRLF